MSATRDPDRLLQAFLDEGPEVLPDRVLSAIQDDVHRLRQRTVRGPWRLSTMRTLLASAAVIAIVVAGAGIFFASRVAPPPTGSSEPTASPSIAALPVTDAALHSGATYDSGTFTHAFTFTVPGVVAAPLRQDMWAGSHTLRLRPASGGAITIHDGLDLPNDLCQPTGVTSDLPNVEEWLAGSEGLIVSPVAQLTNSNLSARYWDIELGPDCYVGDDPPGSPAIAFSAGEHHRLYEVQVGNDTILVATWGAGYGGEGDEVLDQLNPLTDELVRSMTNPE
jgi:hypothetical protein